MDARRRDTCWPKKQPSDTGHLTLLARFGVVCRAFVIILHDATFFPAQAFFFVHIFNIWLKRLVHEARSLASCINQDTTAAVGCNDDRRLEHDVIRTSEYATTSCSYLTSSSGMAVAMKLHADAIRTRAGSFIVVTEK